MFDDVWSFMWYVETRYTIWIHTNFAIITKIRSQITVNRVSPFNPPVPPSSPTLSIFPHSTRLSLCPFRVCNSPVSACYLSLAILMQFHSPEPQAVPSISSMETTWSAWFCTILFVYFWLQCIWVFSYSNKMRYRWYEPHSWTTAAKNASFDRYKHETCWLLQKTSKKPYQQSIWYRRTKWI